MDIIYLRDLRIDTIIGVYDWERHVKQTLVFDMEIGMDNRKAAAHDAIEDAVDYGEVANRVTALVEASRVQLLETLVEQVAALIQKDFQAPWVKLKVNKLGALTRAREVGVVIERGNSGSTG